MDKAQFGGIKAYAGYYNDHTILNNSASGGAASIFAEEIIRTGGIVYGAVFSPSFISAEFGRFSSVEQLAPFKGSKYIPTKKQVWVNGEYKSVYSLVAEDLTAGKQVLFCGLGCDIGALLRFLKTKQVDTTKLFTIDLICHGPTPQLVAEKFVAEVEKKYRAKIKSMNMRSKNETWAKSPHLHIEFDNGKVYDQRFYDSDYGYAFAHLACKPCMACQFKGEKHLADITIGDYWGVTKEMPGWNENGVSLILVRTNKGQEFLDRIDKSVFTLSEADLDIALEHNPMFWKSRDYDPVSEVFEKLLRSNGLHYAVKKTMGFNQKIRRTWIFYLIRRIKNFISLC